MTKRGIELGTFCSRERCLNHSATAMISLSMVDKVGSRTVTMKSTWHGNFRVYVCFTAIGNGAKMNPFALNKELQRKCVIASSEDGWMNTD